MPQNGVYDLLKMLDIALDAGYNIFKYSIVNKKEIEDLIDRIYSALPVEVQEARVFLKRKEELQAEAQAKADKIIAEAQAKAEKMLSQSDQLKAIEREGIRIKNEVVTDCENIKHTALQDSEKIRLEATDEAMKIREGAQLYAQRVLTSLEGNLTQLQQGVKECQIYMEKMKNDSANRYVAATSESSNSRNWVQDRDAKSI